jgi:sigma-B regulation protein RsbU (phosphoserine phosphatase)
VENSPLGSSLRNQREELENRLYLQQLQINRLLEITQAINNNLKIADLFRIYKDTLTWEMRIKKFALFTRHDEEWTCVSHAGIDEKTLFLCCDEVYNLFPKFQRASKIDEPQHPLLQHFNIVIPVYHKKFPIAFTFIGKDLYEEDNDVYEPIRFISAITNIIAVAIENKRLFKKQIAQERMRRELELAVQVQNMLIPSNLPMNDQIEFSGIYQPHEGIGGDYYDLIELGERELAFCIADISGKGIAAALLMSNFQANLQSLINRKYLSVRQFANKLNERVLRTTKGEKFITFFIARYHRFKKRLRYLNAGHNPPIMISGGKIHYLKKGCTILGAFNKLPEIELGEVYLEEDAFFLLYTDGLTDLRNEEGEFFDEEKLAKFALENYKLSAVDFNKALMDKIKVFKGSLDFPDDISVLTGRIFVDKCAEKEMSDVILTAPNRKIGPGNIFDLEDIESDPFKLSQKEAKPNNS